MRHGLNSILYTGVMAALISLAPAYCQPQPAAPPATPQQPGQPNLGNRKPASIGSAPKSAPAPAARYSPLAAQGGYRGHGMTWYDALFHSLNPKNIDWGMSWEQRRSIFLENSIGNKYFMYTAALSLLLVYSFVVIIWQRWNHAELLKQLAQRTADKATKSSVLPEGMRKIEGSVNDLMGNPTTGGPEDQTNKNQNQAANQNSSPQNTQSKRKDEPKGR